MGRDIVGQTFVGQDVTVADAVVQNFLKQDVAGAKSLGQKVLGKDGASGVTTAPANPASSGAAP